LTPLIRPHERAKKGCGARDIPFRGIAKHVVEDLQHVVVVADLRPAGRVVLVRRLGWNLIPHLGEVHEYAGVVLDHFLELAQHRGELLLSMLINVVNCVAQPLAMDTIVGRQPGARSEEAVSLAEPPTSSECSGLPVDPMLGRDVTMVAVLMYHFG
jgi:hypothetical protein